MSAYNNVPVQEIMTSRLLTVRPEDTLKRIRDIFAANYLHHLPVVNASQHLVGIVSKYDLNKVERLLEFFPEKSSDELCVQDIMTSPVITVSPEVSLRRVASIFLDNLFHALPVMQDKELVGIITSHDLMQYAFELDPVARE
jgi:acetoin utilization protein AcuB